MAIGAASCRGCERTWSPTPGSDARRIPLVNAPRLAVLNGCSIVLNLGHRCRLTRRLQLGRWMWWLAAAVPALTWVVRAALDSPSAVSQPSSDSRATSNVQLRPEPAHPVPVPFSAAGLQARQAQRALWQERLERAQGTLDAFRQSTRYPHESQPLSEHPDQAYPNESITEEHPLSKAGGNGVEGVSLRTTQERVFVQGQESVRFTVSLRDNAGQVLPLRVVRASARELPPPNSGSLYAEVPLVFNDDGSAGDAVAGDGIYSVQLQPAAQGFTDLLGQIRIERRGRLRGAHGRAHRPRGGLSHGPHRVAGNAVGVVHRCARAWPDLRHTPGRHPALPRRARPRRSDRHRDRRAVASLARSMKGPAVRG